MKTQTLTPHDRTIKRYPAGESVLYICDTEIATFEATLPDAQSVRESVFYFQKDHADNVFQAATQFGQYINKPSVNKISIYGQYQTVMLVSDGENYRMLQGVVPELPVTLPIGRWIFKQDSNNNFIQQVNTSGDHGAPSWKNKRGITENA